MAHYEVTLYSGHSSYRYRGDNDNTVYMDEVVTTCDNAEEAADLSALVEECLDDDGQLDDELFESRR